MLLKMSTLNSEYHFCAYKYIYWAFRPIFYFKCEDGLFVYIVKLTKDFADFK